MIKNLWKSEKGFTVQDLVLAIAILILAAGIIGSIYVAIYQLEAQTQVDATATVRAVQVMERIDKLGYMEVTDDTKSALIEEMKSEFEIPNAYHIDLEIIPYLEEDLVKTVKMTMTYRFLEQDRTIVIERLKVKEKEQEA